MNNLNHVDNHAELTLSRYSQDSCNVDGLSGGSQPSLKKESRRTTELMEVSLGYLRAQTIHHDLRLTLRLCNVCVTIYP